MASGPIISGKIEGGKVETLTDFSVLRLQKSLWIAAMKLEDISSREEKLREN